MYSWVVLGTFRKANKIAIETDALNSTFKDIFDAQSPFRFNIVRQNNEQGVRRTIARGIVKTEHIATTSGTLKDVVDQTYLC